MRINYRKVNSNHKKTYKNKLNDNHCVPKYFYLIAFIYYKKSAKKTTYIGIEINKDKFLFFLDKKNKNFNFFIYL